jgi:hypothetical protein
LESPLNIQIVKETNNKVIIFDESKEEKSFSERYSHEFENRKHPKHAGYIRYDKLGKKRKKVIHPMNQNSGYSDRIIKEDGINIGIGRIRSESQPKCE